MRMVRGSIIFPFGWGCQCSLNRLLFACTRRLQTLVRYHPGHREDPVIFEIRQLEQGLTMTESGA